MFQAPVTRETYHISFFFSLSLFLFHSAQLFAHYNDSKRKIIVGIRGREASSNVRAIFEGILCAFYSTLKPKAFLLLSRFSFVGLPATLWTAAHQSLFVGSSRQEYWSGLPCPPPGDLLNPGIEPLSSVSPALHSDSSPTELPGEPKA